MNSFLQDIRFAIHALVKRPGFSSIVILTLALGIGANTAVFSVIDTVVFRPLSFSEPDELVVIRPMDKERATLSDSVSYLNFADWQEQSHVFAHMAVFTHAQFTVTGVGHPISVDGTRVSGEFFLLTVATNGFGYNPRCISAVINLLLSEIKQSRLSNKTNRLINIFHPRKLDQYAVGS